MALKRSTARRYAEAAFEIAVRDDTVSTWLEALTVAEARLAGAETSRFLANPSLAAAARVTVLERILGSEVTGAPRNLLALMIWRGRFELLPDVIREFRRLHRRREGIVEATLTSAGPLEPAVVQAIEARIVAMTGQRVELAQAVDASLLGGLQVKVGDRLIDASVRGRLERLRATFDSIVT